MTYPHVLPILEAFSKLTYPEFDNFSVEDVETFLNDDSHFALAFKKAKAKGLLYGFEHVRLRARLINELPDAERLAILSRKINYTGVFLEQELMTLQDIYDIGMGHSVYLLHFPDKKWVLKPRDAKNQLFYCDVLKTLQWPSFEAREIRTSHGTWELSEYLEGDVLGALFQPGACLIGAIEKELAYHAALGDILGRGDRHFENYVVSQGHLYPIDLSYLFWEDNETWLSRYISGGMAEFSFLGFFIQDPLVFSAKVESFFQHYRQTLDFLNVKKDVLRDIIFTYFSKEDAERAVRFVAERLDHADAYFDSQKMLYSSALTTYLKRMSYKTQLESLGKRQMDFLDENPRLKMYYLADKGRLSAFFLEEVFGKDEVFRLLDALRIKSNNL